MTYVLAALVVVLLAERYISDRRHARDRERLLNAVIARHPGEVASLNREPRKPRELSDAQKLSAQLDNPIGL